MKFELALAALASLTSATKLRQDDGAWVDDYWSCFSDWIWEDCSGLYYQVDLCNEDAGGWWYAMTPDFDGTDDWWVSEEEFAGWDWCTGGLTDGLWEDDWNTWEDDWDLEWEDDWNTWDDDWADWEDDWTWDDDWENDWELDWEDDWT